jgi:putative N6-adenine-specific DNA methylase
LTEQGAGGIELVATAAFGVEAVVARELQQLGFSHQEVENGRVTFRSSPQGVCRANLWLRSADRVLLKMGEFSARTFEELFEGTRALPWPDWIPRQGAFPVRGKSVRSQLASVPACQAIVKKAIVEKMAQHYRQQWFAETGPVFPVEVALLKDRVTLTIDTSGPGLHKRGYRVRPTAAPLKETLAAAMVQLSRWRPERELVDPLCGSGTIPIEAALLGFNLAPGLRRRFVAENWPAVPEQLWRQERARAMDQAHLDRRLEVWGADADAAAIAAAQANAEAAGLGGRVRWRCQPVSRLASRGQFGWLVCNPPYGERMGEARAVEDLYRELGRVYRRLETWSCFVLTSHPGFERLFGRRADRRRKLYNGRLQCTLFQFFGPRPPGPRPRGE